MADALQVVAAVIVRDGRVLACRRSPDRSAGGLWEFPGGKVEAGESPEGALAREIREELGVDIEVRGLVHRGVTLVGAASIDLSCYAATLTDAVPKASSDHDSLRWLRRDELGLVKWAEPDRTVAILLVDEVVPAWTGSSRWPEPT